MNQPLYILICRVAVAVISGFAGWHLLYFSHKDLVAKKTRTYLDHISGVSNGEPVVLKCRTSIETTTWNFPWQKPELLGLVAIGGLCLGLSVAMLALVYHDLP